MEARDEIEVINEIEARNEMDAINGWIPELLVRRYRSSLSF